MEMVEAGLTLFAEHYEFMTAALLEVDPDRVEAVLGFTEGDLEHVCVAVYVDGMPVTPAEHDLIERAMRSLFDVAN